MTLQGTPAATLFEGIGLLTREPAPMIQLSPIIPPLKNGHVCTEINVISNTYNTRGTKEFSKEWQKDPVAKIMCFNGKMIIYIHIVAYGN